jgi:hypothetical protein
MAYIPDATDDTQPLITEIAKTAAAEFRTLKTYIKTLRDIPRSELGFIRGYCTVATGDITINTTDLVAGYTFSIYNNTNLDITLIQGAGVTLRLSGTVNSGNRTIAARGLVTLWCPSGTEVVAIGAGLS